MKNKICLFFMIFFMVLIFVGCKMDVNSTTNDNQSTSENQKPTTDTDISESVPSNSETNYFSLFGTDADPYKEWRNMEDGTILGIPYSKNYVSTNVWVGDAFIPSNGSFHFEGGNPESRDYRFANGQIGINGFYRKTITENELGNIRRAIGDYLACAISDSPESVRVISQNLYYCQYRRDLADEIVEKFRANPDAEPTPIYKAKLNEAENDVEWVDGVVEGTPVLTNELVASVTGFKEDVRPYSGVASEMWYNGWTYTAEFEVRDERTGYEGKTYYVYIGYTYAPDGSFKESAGEYRNCLATIRLDAEQKFEIYGYHRGRRTKTYHEIKLSKDFPASMDTFKEMCELKDGDDEATAELAISIVWGWLVDVNDGSQKQTTYTYTVDGVEYTKTENNWDRLVRVYNFYHQNDPIL